MKLFLHINAKKIETVISYFDNYLWFVGIQMYNYFNAFKLKRKKVNNMGFLEGKTVIVTGG